MSDLIRRLMVIPLFGLAALALLFPGSALAVLQVRGEAWRSPGKVLASPLSSTIQVSFTADVTQRDRALGMQFSIDLAGWAIPTPMVSFLVRTADLPADIGRASFAVSFAMSGDPASSRGMSSDGQCVMTYVHDGQTVHRSFPASSYNALSLPMRFGFTVADQSHAPGPNPMARDALYLTTPRTIGVFFDPDGTTCAGTILPGTPATVYVLGKLDEGTPGIAGAEFRFSGLPLSWTAYPVASPSILAIGNPFGDGVTMGFPCQRPVNGAVLLYTVLIIATTEVHDVQLGLEPRYSSTTRLQCPVIVDCDAPVFTVSCVRPVSCSVNPTRPGPCAVITAVVPRSWSGVKGLYR